MKLLESEALQAEKKEIPGRTKKGRNESLNTDAGNE